MFALFVAYLTSVVFYAYIPLCGVWARYILCLALCVFVCSFCGIPFSGIPGSVSFSGIKTHIFVEY